LYVIAKSGPVRDIAPASPSAAAPASPSATSAFGNRGGLDTDLDAAPETGASAPGTLENPGGPVPLAPGFEDEGMDEEPSPSKPSAPKRFATVQEAADKRNAEIDAAAN
jgi:hypothetical protein